MPKYFWKISVKLTLMVAELLIPVFLPFNLMKGGLNAAFTMILYKPVVTAFRCAHLL